MPTPTPVPSADAAALPARALAPAASPAPLSGTPAQAASALPHPSDATADAATDAATDAAADAAAHAAALARVQRVVDFFEQLSPHSLSAFGQHYTEDASFKDPFNAVRGLSAVQAIFSHMYVALHEPRFVVTERVVQGEQCFLVWDFVFRFKRFSPSQTQTIRGSSHLRFAPDGRIAYHRDYWDAAEELYEKLPLIGGLMRWLKARANS